MFRIDGLGCIDICLTHILHELRPNCKQLYSPVRWTETIEILAKSGISLVVEAGPGKVLQGLIKRIDKSITSASINDQASLTKALETIK